MTLFKQITILLSLLLLVILLTVTTLVFNAAIESLQNRLYEDAQNTAASLSLSLGVAGGDLSTMETMINANFDSGHYESIVLTDTDGNTLYVRQKENGSHADIPKWFHSLVHIEAPVASANVSSGWRPVGILNVVSDAEYAYVKLYEVFKQLFVSFLVIYVVALSLLYLLMHYILKPLKTIRKQAEAITRNEFIVQEELPYTKEFRELVLAMNTMVKKVQQMFEKANSELKQLKEKEYTDPVTKLKNRKYFINKLPEYLKIDAPSRYGTHIMIALNGVIEANKRIGYKKVDELFVAIAKVLTQSVAGYKDVIVARMNGTEFSILIPGCNVYEALDIAKSLQVKINALIEEFGLDADETYVDIGLHEYSYMQKVSELLTLSDNALAKAKLDPDHIYFEEREDVEEIMSKDEWRQIIRSALQNDGLELVAYKVLDTRDNTSVHEALTITLCTEDKFYTYGQFIASAMQVGMMHEVYEKVIETLLKKYSNIFESKAYSLRLPSEFLEDPDTYTYMASQLQQYASRLRFELIIEMPDRFVTQNEQSARLYKELFTRYGVQMGIFEFIGEQSDYHYLHELKPVYIKSQYEFFLGLEPSNLNALKLLAQSIDIDLIAVGVMDKTVLHRLQEREIYIVQGKVVELI